MLNTIIENKKNGKLYKITAVNNNLITIMDTDGDEFNILKGMLNDCYITSTKQFNIAEQVQVSKTDRRIKDIMLNERRKSYK